MRFIALDLLSDEPRLGEVLQRWETFVPVWIPFGSWAMRVASEGATSLTQAVRQWLSSYDEERLWPLIEDGLSDGRVILLVDGLDECTDAAAAVETFSHLAVFVRQRDLPLLATSRPTALEELGPVPREWNLGSLAGLSADQQRAIVEGLDADATSEFLEAISRSPDLRGLAATPLLLILLLRLYEAGQALPRNRFAAYAAVLDFLVEEHPRRRGVTPSGPRPTRELKASLARIAFEIQRTGDVALSEARAEHASAGYFEDGTLGPGLPGGEARAAAAAVVTDARTRLGLLVRDAPGALAFPHRSLQEYLAAFCLSAEPLDVRQAVVAEHGPEPAWHEVILNLIALSGSADADSLIGVVEQNRTPLERWTLQPLLADIAAARFGSPTVAERLPRQVIELIETAPVSSLRLDVLARVSDAVSEVDEFRQRVPSWLPSLEQNRRGVFEAMRSWPEEAGTREAIWRALFDEDTATARAAARTYAERYSADPHAQERLVDLLRQPLEGKTRAAALEALVSSWPDDDTIPHLIENAHSSVDPNLRLVAHSWRIDRGEQTDDDLADLLALGGDRGNVDYDRRSDLWIAIKDGWPRNEAVRDAALRTSRRQGSSRELELDLALWLLLAGYPGDPEVITYCVNQIEHEDHPFLMLHFEAWRLLAANFRDEPTIVAALDEWIPRQEFREPEVAFACLVGRTEIGKRTMVARLAAASFPHWFADALLEGWGMADPEVATALTTAALGESDLAGRIAGSIPKIIDDVDRCQARLEELVGDTENRRPALAIKALGGMGALTAETVDTVVARESERETFDHEVWYALVRYAPENPGVRELAKKCYDDELYSRGAVAESYANDSEMRDLVRQHATPLPAQLRQRLAERLRAGVGDSALTAAITARFLQEIDPLAASTQAQAHVRTVENADALIERLKDGVSALGMTYERIRQTALTALLELGRAEVFAEAREPLRPEQFVDVRLTDFLRPNVVLADTVVKRWEDLHAAVGDVVKRLSHQADERTTWDVLALVADQSPRVRELALEFVDSGRGLSANLLHLYSRARPRSASLAEVCLAALRGRIVDRSASRDLIVAGAEVFGANFGGDDTMPSRLVGEDLPLSSLLMALAEGWPDSDELRRAREAAQRERLTGPWEALLRVQVAAGDAEHVLAVLRRLVERLAWHPHHEDRALGVIVRRMRRDPHLVTALECLIAAEPQPSELASFARLLGFAGVLDQRGRDSLRATAERFLAGDDAVEIGFDLIATEYRPVAFSLLDALYGSPAQASQGVLGR